MGDVAAPDADRPEGTALALALVRWQRAAGRYWPYVCSAPFAGDPVAPVSGGEGRPSKQLLDLIAAIPAGQRPAVFVDLPPRISLPTTERLNALGFLVVPVIQRWVTRPAVLDCGRLVDHLIRYGAIARRPSPARGVVFLLDGDRAGPPRPRDSLGPSRGFDNRYDYPPCRFPPPSLLRDDGITGVWWLSRSGIAGDLVEYAERIGAVGLPPLTRDARARR